VNVAELLAGLLARVPAPKRPLLVAYAERLAAERYRGWAKEIGSAAGEAGLRACAEREEEIARSVESLHPDAAATQRALLSDHPDLLDVNRTLFAGRPLSEQFGIQAQGERAGAALWRRLAETPESPRAKEIYLRCAALEEESAVFLEALLRDAP
jgi:hypothetical protein